MNTVDRRKILGASVALAAAAKARANFTSIAPAQDDLSKIGKTPHTRFAVNIEIWWSQLPLVDRIKKTAAHGFPAIEFWPWRGRDMDAFEKTTKDLGLEVAQFTAWPFEPGMNDPANHAKVVDEIREACRVANKLNCKAMCVVAGNDQPGMTTEQMHANVITALKLAAPVARDHGVTLILEPMNGRVDHPGHCLYGSEAGVRICKAVGSPFVKLNWDLYHAQLAEGDLCGHLKDGKEYIGYAQVADAPGRHEPGTGEIFYPRVLRQLHELGYRGAVGLECWPLEGEEAAMRRVSQADLW